MKITKDSTMYIGLVSMASTKTNCISNILRYNITKAYYDIDTVYEEADKIVKDAYEKIISGKITFCGINNFNKSKVKFTYSDRGAEVYYIYDNGHRELLCDYVVSEIQLLSKYFTHPKIFISDDTEEMRYILQKTGMYWYLISNFDDNITFEKRFLWFTKLDTMLNYIFNKLEFNALTWDDKK